MAENRISEEINVEDKNRELYRVKLKPSTDKLQGRELV